MSDPSPKQTPPWTRVTTVGFEYVAAVAGFGLLGWWIDSRWGTKPWGVLIGAALGLTGATYNLVRQGMAAMKTPPPKKHSSDDREGKKRTRT